MIIVAAWTVVVFLWSAAAHVLWHWPVRRKMAAEDKLVRGGLLLVMVDIVAVGVLALVTTGRQVLLWASLPVLALAGTCIAVGFSVLLWRFRFRRDTAAITTSVGELTRSDEEKPDG